MKISEKGIALIKSFEGCLLKAFWDVDGYSIGYGHHSGVTKDMVITQEQADSFLRSDLAWVEKRVNKYDEKYKWTQNEFDALCDYCYNIGSIDKLTDHGNRTKKEIAADMPNHNTAGGKVLAGLTRRRLAEQKMFLESVGGNKMNENEITLCGHGSGRPSYKNMESYLEGRYHSIASNGKHKGVVKVMRLKVMTDAGRETFKSFYDTLIGRNYYNQNLRSYVYTPYKNGLYYSDCSSSGMATLAKAGFKVSLLNTAGIYQSDLFEEVPVEIKDGHIMNPEVLKVADAVLFVGNDPSRPLQIGHVEWVYNIPDTKAKYPIWLRVGNKYVLRIADGKNAHGWCNVAEKSAAGNIHRYYFDEKGYMLTGPQYIDGKLYYFKESGGLEGTLCCTDAEGAVAPMYLKKENVDNVLYV